MCRGEYINIALLLQGAMELQHICSGCTLLLTSNGRKESKTRECKDKVQPIKKWTDAFFILMSIFTKHNHSKRGDCVDKGSRFQARWVLVAYILWAITYQTAHFSFFMGSIYQDLWLQCMSFKNVLSDMPQWNLQKVNFCDDYNQGYCYWTICKYQHKCSKFGLPHPRVTCQSTESMSNIMTP